MRARKRLVIGLLFPVIAFLWMIGWCMFYIGSDGARVERKAVPDDDSALTTDTLDEYVVPIFEDFAEDTEAVAG